MYHTCTHSGTCTGTSTEVLLGFVFCAPVQSVRIQYMFRACTTGSTISTCTSTVGAVSWWEKNRAHGVRTVRRARV